MPETNETNAQTQTTGPDILVENHGSIFLFRPLTSAAKEWLENNVDGEAQWFGGALVIEPRYARDLAHGAMEEGGLSVK